MEGTAMLWIIAGVALLSVFAVGAWLLGPTIQTFRGPDFEPAPKDDVSVLLAKQSSSGADGLM